MIIENITLELINTKISRATCLSRGYTPFDDFSGYLKRGNEKVLLTTKDISKYERFKKVRIYHVSDETLNELKGKVRILSLNKSKYIITKLDAHYFNLVGKSNKEKRNVINKYGVNNSIIIQENNNSLNDVKVFLRNWKEKRKSKYFEKMIFTGYDLNFITNYLSFFKNYLYARFFYDKKKLVGLTVIEKVNENLFNLLIRKADPEYSQLTYYIDFTSFREIFNNSSSEFIIINLGTDGGDKGIRNYKTKKFPFGKEINTYKIQVEFP